ncbi:MAG: hypothetical protein WDN76_05800 [Alphaproteobacteria bacterium]
MYDPTDPRSSLAKTGPNLNAPQGQAADAEYGRWYEEPPKEDDKNGKTWYGRGQNFIISYSETKPGAVFERKGQIDEWVILVPDRDTPFECTFGSQTEKADGYSIVIMPPGDSKITLPKGGRITRLFTTRSKDLTVKCANNDPTPCRTTTSRRWKTGPIRSAASRSAFTRLTCRRKRAAWAASGVARRSW